MYISDRVDMNSAPSRNGGTFILLPVPDGMVVSFVFAVSIEYSESDRLGQLYIKNFKRGNTLFVTW